MTLPIDFKEQLVQELRGEPLTLASDLRHTVPLHAGSWLAWNSRLSSSAERFYFVAAANHGAGLSRPAIDSIVSEALSARRQFEGIVLALVPFLPFDPEEVNLMTRAMAIASNALADTLVSGAMNDVSDQKTITDGILHSWSAKRLPEKQDILRIAFGMESDPLTTNGDFSANRVFARYVYNNGEMIKVVYPHLLSMGVTTVDPLVAVSVLGAMLWAPDPVSSYCAFQEILLRLTSADVRVAAKFIDYVDARAEVARQARRLTLDRVVSFGKAPDSETRALALSEIYKKVVEGPIRIYGWALLSLQCNSWSDPPMLTELRQRMVSAGAFPRDIAESTILVDIRNGEAHEQLEWNGYREVFVIGSGETNFQDVRDAALGGLCVDGGGRAAVAIFKTAKLEPKLTTPDIRDQNRMAPYFRVEAALGSNGLVCIRSDLNALRSRIWLDSFVSTDINPSLQALLQICALYPEIELFEIRVDEGDRLVFVASKEDLEASREVWDFAQKNLTRMPFSTFLPTNMRVRMAGEGKRSSFRAAAWIAVDDVLDAHHGASDPRGRVATRAHREILEVRVTVALMAVGACRRVPEAGEDLRLRTIESELGKLLGVLQGDTWENWVVLDGSLDRLWNLGEAWGPVPRMLGVKEVDRPRDPEPQPGLHVGPRSPYFSTY